MTLLAAQPKPSSLPKQRVILLLWELRLSGISPDTTKKHEKFSAKHNLDIILLADEHLEALNAYSVWVEKKMYGKTYMGVERSTFLIDADGKIVKIWRKVRVKGHVEAVLEAATSHFKR